jgi:spermidine/putrescine transport system permease protein
MAGLAAATAPVDAAHAVGSAAATPGTAHDRPRRPRRAIAAGPWPYLALPLGFVVFAFVVPLAAMGVHSLHTRRAGRIVETLSLDNYRAFVEKDWLWGALVNSLELTALVTLITLPLAWSFAAALAFAVPKRWRTLAVILAVLPFFTSYIVRTYAWLLVLADQGVINATLASIGLIGEPLPLVNTRVGVVIVFVHYYTMIMALAIFANLVQIPANCFRAARDLGASDWQLFLRVVLPLSIPGTMVGVFLTLVLAIGDYVTPQIVGGGSELVLPQAVMLQIGRFSDTPLAAALSVILMGVVGVLAAGFARWLRTEHA